MLRRSERVKARLVDSDDSDDEIKTDLPSENDLEMAETVKESKHRNTGRGRNSKRVISILGKDFRFSNKEEAIDENDSISEPEDSLAESPSANTNKIGLEVQPEEKEEQKEEKKVKAYRLRGSKYKHEKKGKIDTFTTMDADILLELHRTRRHVHQLDKDFIITYLKTRIDNSEIDIVDGLLHIICSHQKGRHKCNKLIPLTKFAKIMPDLCSTQSELITRGLFRAYDKKNLVVYCPNPKCHGANGIILEAEPESNCIQCSIPKCGKMWCRNCKVAPYHEGVGCQLNRLFGMNENDPNFKYLKDNAQACPKCGRFVQKDYGCDHMHCGGYDDNGKSVQGCGAYFCYVCGEELLETYNKHVVMDSTIGTYVCPKRLNKNENLAGKEIKREIPRPIAPLEEIEMGKRMKRTRSVIRMLSIMRQKFF